MNCSPVSDAKFIEIRFSIRNKSKVFFIKKCGRTDTQSSLAFSRVLYCVLFHVDCVSVRPPIKLPLVYFLPRYNSMPFLVRDHNFIHYPLSSEEERGLLSPCDFS